VCAPTDTEPAGVPALTDEIEPDGVPALTDEVDPEDDAEWP